MKVRYLKSLADFPPPPADWVPDHSGEPNWVVFSLNDLTDGRIYEVVSIEDGLYRIVDDGEEDYLYGPGVFEIVEALPVPPVLTREDIKQGKGDIHIVVKYPPIDEDNLVFPEGMTIEDWRAGRCEAYDRPKGYYEYPKYAESLELEVAEPSTARYGGVLV